MTTEDPTGVQVTTPDGKSRTLLRGRGMRETSSGTLLIVGDDGVELVAVFGSGQWSRAEILFDSSAANRRR